MTKHISPLQDVLVELDLFMACRFSILLLFAQVAWAVSPTEQHTATKAVPFKSPNETTRIEVHHTFPEAEAHKRLGYLLDYWRERFGLKSQWSDSCAFITGNAFGVKINLLCKVTHAKILCTANDVHSTWRNAALAYLRKKLQKYMHVNYEDT